MHIALINTGNDAGIAGNANEGAYPPLSIISLATGLKRAYGESVDVSLYDGQVDHIDNIVSGIQSTEPDVVGISMYLTSIRNTVRIIKESKEIGATVVLGNDHASTHAELLMRKVPEIDYICTNDVGEETLVGLIHALLYRTPVDAIPGLAFRAGEKIVFSTTTTAFGAGYSLDNLAIPDRRLLPKHYWIEYSRRFHAQKRKLASFDHRAVVSTINRGRGCAQTKNRCRYCGILDLTPRFSTAKIFWADVRAAREDVGATILYEAYDSASSSKSVLKDWAKHRPDDLLTSRFKMYVQAFESDEEVVKLLRGCLRTTGRAGRHLTAS